MSLSISEWEAEVSKLPTDDLVKIDEGFDALGRWEAFGEHWNWTAIGVISSIVKQELSSRER